MSQITKASDLRALGWVSTGARWSHPSLVETVAGVTLATALKMTGDDATYLRMEPPWPTGRAA